MSDLLVVVNGERRTVPPGATLADVLDALGCPRRGVAVAVGREVVPRAAWTQRVLRHGDEIDVLTAAQGG